MKEYKQKSIQRVTAISIIGATFAVILGFYLLSKNISHILSIWGESHKLIVYLDSESDDALRRSTQSRLEKSVLVEKVVFFSKEQAIEDFNAQISGYMSGLKNDAALLQVIPPYFEVYLKSEGSLDELNSKAKNLALEIREWMGIEDVSNGSLWTEKYSKLSQSVNAFFVFLGLILFTLSFFVVSSSIKSHLFQRAKEIEILEMIGATKFYIQRPIFVESVGIISVAFAIGLAVNTALYYYFNSFFDNQLKLLNLSQVFQFFNVLELTTAFTISIGMGLIVTRLTFSRLYRYRHT
ncbi:MAG: FtsX-like permease family protein [Bdellovibrionaceae bacterium]|jgi:cell division transport system permease protein|nr:FtsX-like permease family protein [Pseudobdellovibrionaceae bacterium]